MTPLAFLPPLAIAVTVLLGGASQVLFRPLDSSSPVSYFVAEGDTRTGFRAGDRQLASWALEEWQRGSLDAVRFEPAKEANAIVRIYWAEATGGMYGEMRPLSVNGRAGAAVFVRPDLDGLGPDIAGRAQRDPLLRDVIVYLTCVHELGHALGLAHTRAFADIMYFFGYGGDIGEYFGRYRARIRSRQDLPRTSPLSAADLERVRAAYAPVVK